MNKLSANLSLYVITLFAAIQYAFLREVPDSVSDFAFLTVTNLIGFLIILMAFASELRRLDKKQITQSLVLAAELIVFNVLLLAGARGTDPTVTACVLSTYFAFIVLFSQLFFRIKQDRNKWIGIGVVLIGVFFMMNADIIGLFNRNILFLIAADVVFAFYLLTTERYSVSSNPAILSIGQLFFGFLLSGACWIAESLIRHTPMALPREQSFWGSVFFISFFIRGLYTIVQIYAQRYTSPLNVALIFSTEIIMTMFASPILSHLFGMSEERITPLRILGAFVMMGGILVADGAVLENLKRRVSHGRAS